MKSESERRKKTKSKTITRRTPNSPSFFPPINLLPASLALLANGISSSPSSCSIIGGVDDKPIVASRVRRRMGMGCLRSETLLAREHSASLNIPANVFLFTPPVGPVVVSGGSSVALASTSFNASTSVFESSTSCPCESTKNPLRNLTTSSNTSSSHRLSLSPSLARMRMSSFFTGTMHVCAVVEGGRCGVCGPSWTGVLYWKRGGLVEMRGRRGGGGGRG